MLGVNGAGKSTLMKIMAGIETEYGGEAWAAPGATVGYLAQEPPLDPTKTVGENVEEAFADLKAALNRFNEISSRFAEPMSDEEMNALLTEQGDLQEKIDSQDGWELDRKGRYRAGCAAVSAGGSTGDEAVRRGEATRSAVQTAAGEA